MKITICKSFNNINKQISGLLLLFIFISPVISFGQYKPKDKFEHINILANDSLFGRGYTNDGLKKASDYIVTYFDSLGLEKFNKNYKQTFSNSVNTLESTNVFINEKELTFGKDYLVSADSKSIQEELTCHYDFMDILPTGNNWEEEPKIWQFIQKAKKQECSPFINSSIENASKIKFYKSHLIGFQSYLHTKFIIEKVKKLSHSVAIEQGEVPTLYLNDSILLYKEDTIQVEIQSKLIEDYKSDNIIGFIKGSDIDAKTILLSAHYDHLGIVNHSIFNGANDNASGVSMLLHLAEYYNQFKPKNNIVFIAFAGEELGLLGSHYFVQHSTFPLKEIDFVLNLDMAGTGIDGIQVVNATEYPKEFSLLQTINKTKNYLKEVKPRGERCNSDHCPFYSVGIPSFFIYTLGGAKHYHDIYDTKENLSLTAYVDFMNLLIDFIDQF